MLQGRHHHKLRPVPREQTQRLDIRCAHIIWRSVRSRTELYMHVLMHTGSPSGDGDGLGSGLGSMNTVALSLVCSIRANCAVSLGSGASASMN